MGAKEYLGDEQHFPCCCFEHSSAEEHTKTTGAEEYHGAEEPPTPPNFVAKRFSLSEAKISSATSIAGDLLEMSLGTWPVRFALHRSKKGH